MGGNGVKLFSVSIAEVFHVHCCFFNVGMYLALMLEQ